MAIDWDDSLATGNDLIDGQHRELFARINALFTACGEGRGRQAVTETIEFLQEYAREHFAAEERQMLSSGYPHYAEHKAQHEEMTDRVNQIRVVLDADGPGPHVVIVTNQVLVDWLLDHVRKTDQRLAAFLRRHYF